MASTSFHVLAINGGSSSIKFALFETGASLKRVLQGAVARIGLPDATLGVKAPNPQDSFTRSVSAPN